MKNKYNEIYNIQIAPGTISIIKCDSFSFLHIK